MRFEELVRLRRDDIVSCWLERSRRMSCAQGLAEQELVDKLPQYLEALAAARLDPADPQTLDELISSHLAARLQQGFCVDEAAAQFTHLARCILTIWLEHGRPDTGDLEWMLDHLEQARAAARREFTEHLLADEQVEKRYLRLLDQVAAESLSAEDHPLYQRADEISAILCESMGGQCAGVFLAQPDGRLQLSASCADCLTLPLGSFINLEEIPFLGLLALVDEVLCVDSRAGPERMLGPFLKPEPHHVLFGRRLWARDRLLGLVYLGKHGDATVPPRTRRRLEVLSRRLALLFDNARLYDQLRGNMRALQREREVRERFVSVLAHDLRSPLAAAKANAQLLLLEQENPEEELRIAYKIIRSINRTDRMIQDLLDANRIRAGEKLPLRIDRCDLGALAAEVVEEMRAVYGDRFVLRAQPGVLGWWSARELKRSLWNLGSNAVKYGREEAPITISVAPRDGTACLAVHNLGTPLLPEERENIFEPFTRGRNTEVARGWGLGLTLVRGTAEAHGGQVEIETTPDGNIFRMVLPFDARQHAEAAVPIS